MVKNSFLITFFKAIDCVYHFPCTGNTSGTFKVDLNVEADASGDDEDDIDWEEG